MTTIFAVHMDNAGPSDGQFVTLMEASDGVEACLRTLEEARSDAYPEHRAHDWSSVTGLTAYEFARGATPAEAWSRTRGEAVSL